MLYLVPDLLSRFLRDLPYSPPQMRRRGLARRERKPSTIFLILAGLIIGALAALTWIEAAAPGSAEAMAHAISPKTWLDARQAKLDARIPPGGFRSCDAAKAAGFGRIWRGEPAYSPWLDKDGDGKACEWNAGLLD
jgi:hypothetical protein